MNKISVIIPIYNDAENLNYLLDSISRSDLKDFSYEILIGDGGSNDNILKVIHSHANLKLTHIVNPFKSSKSININSCLEISQGEIIFLLDSHCMINKNYFHNGVKLLTESEDCCGIGPCVEIVTTRQSKISKVICSIYKSPFLLGPSKFKNSFFYKSYEGEISTIFCGVFWKRDIDTIDGFDESVIRKQDVIFLKHLKESTEKKLKNSYKLKLDYILKQSTLTSFMKRIFIQGNLIFDDILSSRVIHYIPFFAAFMVLAIALYNLNLALIIIFLYFIASFLFTFFESKLLISSLIGALIFPLIHSSFVIGNISAILKKIFFAFLKNKN